MVSSPFLVNIFLTVEYPSDIITLFPIPIVLQPYVSLSGILIISTEFGRFSKTKSFAVDSGINNMLEFGAEHNVVKCKEYDGTLITYDSKPNFNKKSWTQV